MIKKYFLMFIPLFLFSESLPNQENAKNIIGSASYGREVIKENESENANLFNKNRTDYYNEVVLNWVNFYAASNPRGQAIEGKQTNMIIPAVVQENNATAQKDDNSSLVSVKGFCYITEDIKVGKQPSALRPECQTNIGSITMFANLVNVNEKASLVVDPVYIEKNGARFKVESSIVTNESKTSYNIATYVNDRKISEIGWGALSVGSKEFQTASNEYLAALEKSKTRQEVEYVTTTDGAGNSYMSPVNTTNTEKPDPLDYLIKGAINLTTSIAANTADIFKKDLPYLYYISGKTKIWIDLKVNRKGEYVKWVKKKKWKKLNTINAKKSEHKQKETPMKIFKIILMLSLFSCPLLAVSTEDFFYQRGLEVGYNKGFDDGVRMAFEESKKVLQKYKDELMSYEIGKYLIVSKYLTYPEVWQEMDDGVVRLRVLPSKIEKPLDVDELFTKFAVIPEKRFNQVPSLELSLEEKNSVLLSARDSNGNDLTQNVSESIQTHNLNIKKTAKNLDVLKQANVVFSDEGNSYKVLFFTQQEKKEFCNSYKICKD